MSSHPAVNGGRPSWTDRDDQLSAGFHRVTCDVCPTVVLVRKMNPAQTSVQWRDSSTCPHLARDASGRPGERCPALVAAIEAEVAAGRLPTEPA